jgi:hypothetical protein
VVFTLPARASKSEQLWAISVATTSAWFWPRALMMPFALLNVQFFAFRFDCRNFLASELKADRASRGRNRP